MSSPHQVAAELLAIAWSPDNFVVYALRHYHFTLHAALFTLIAGHACICVTPVDCFDIQQVCAVP